MSQLVDLLKWMFIPHLPSLPGEKSGLLLELSGLEVEWSQEDWERFQYLIPAAIFAGTFYATQHPDIIKAAIEAVPATVDAVVPT